MNPVHLATAKTKATAPKMTNTIRQALLRPLPHQAATTVCLMICSHCLQSDPKQMVCEFFLQGICRYGSYCHYLHNFGTHCPNCGESVANSTEEQEKVNRAGSCGVQGILTRALCAASARMR